MSGIDSLEEQHSQQMSSHLLKSMLVVSRAVVSWVCWWYCKNHAIFFCNELSSSLVVQVISFGCCFSLKELILVVFVILVISSFLGYWTNPIFCFLRDLVFHAIAMFFFPFRLSRWCMHAYPLSCLSSFFFFS